MCFVCVRVFGHTRFGVLRMLTYAAVVSNAFVIAYTSDYIPRMVYKYVYSPDSSLWGYIDHSLSGNKTNSIRLSILSVT